MSDDDARAIIQNALHRVAPEVDVASIDPATELQLEVDLDSIDFLAVVTNVSEAIGVDIPERDYPRLLTLDDFVAYVVGATTGAG